MFVNNKTISLKSFLLYSIYSTIGTRPKCRFINCFFLYTIYYKPDNLRKQTVAIKRKTKEK